jgi:multicomponent Na+:H+ antiporter subunit A
MAPDAGTHDSPAMSLPARAAWVSLPLGVLAGAVWLLVTHDLPVAWSHAWVPALGLDLAFRVDGLSALMLLMVAGVGTAVFVYAGGYFAGHPRQHHLFLLLTLFMVAMVGCVTADHLILLFLFWELTSVLSFLLVGFNHEQAASRRSAQQALIVTGSGGLALLTGCILLAQEMGTASISAIVVALPGTAPTPTLTVALLLILAGAFTKSAQFPFHFWLPNAMSAPTPVSAYLHSATMVKLGVYLLARLDPAFGHWELWQWALKGAGSITAAWGMVLALRDRDLKRILAWSTVATLGTLVTLIGLRGDGASVAVGVLLLAHALYKAPLFFVAGNIDHGTGTRVIDRLGNLRHAMPWTAAAALLAGMSMAGMPLSFGYIVKDAIFEAKSAGDVFAFARVANTVFGAIAVAVAGVAAVRVFWRHPGVNVTIAAHEVGPSLLAPPLALALVGIALGLFPFVADQLIAQVAVAITPGAEAVAVSLVPQFGPALGSLLVTFMIGATVFTWWDPLHRLLERMAVRIGRVGMAAQYERALGALPRGAARITRTLQHGRLPGYLALSVGSVVLALAAMLACTGLPSVWPAWRAPAAGFAAGCALVVAGALLAVMLRDRLALVLATGLVGYGSAVLFLFAGAPDVAFTQFTVETVFVVVVAAVRLRLGWQGRGRSLVEPLWRPGAFVIAAGLGTIVAVLLLATGGAGFDAALSHYFGAASVPEAYGRNVVNVILVDFRALDTLGEITVVLLSLLAAAPLLAALRRGIRGRESSP